MRALALVAALVACGPKATGPVSNAPVQAHPDWTGNDLDVIPVDVEMVIGVNWAHAAASPLFGELVAPKLAHVESLERFKSICKFDPITSIKSATFGFRDLDAAKPEMVAVIHGLDRAAVATCIDKDRDQIANQGAKITMDGDVGLIAQANGTQAAYTFLDDHTLLIATGARHASRAGIEELAKHASGLRTSPAFNDMLRALHTNQAMWGLLNGSTKLFQGMPVRIKAVTGNVELTDGIAVEAHLVMNDPAEATQLANLIRGQATGAKNYVDRLDIVEAGAQVDVRVTMSRAKILQLAPMLGLTP